MKTALDRTFSDWKQRVLEAVDGCLDPARPVRTPGLAGALAEVVRWDGCPRASDLQRPAAGAYGRFPLVDPAAAGYSALLIRWPGAYVTEVHDHDGLWGVEVVLDGALEVTSYVIARHPRLRLDAHRRDLLGVGDCAVFSGVDHAHRCRNLSSTGAALSLHIYGGALRGFQSYHRTRGDAWTAQWCRTAQVDVLA